MGISPREIHTSAGHAGEEATTLYWAAVFFIIAIVAALFGFGGIAAGAASVAKVLFVVFLALAVISLIMGRRPRA